MVSTTGEARVVIVFDALCGWSYAAWPTLEAIWKTNRDRVAFDVVSGGLFVGDRVQPIGTIAYIPTANQRISELSGAVFGDGYEALRSEGSYLLDSTGPAWRFAVLRSLAPDRAVPLAHDLQRRHYLDGADLDQPDVYEAVADRRRPLDRRAAHRHGQRRPRGADRSRVQLRQGARRRRLPHGAVRPRRPRPGPLRRSPRPRPARRRPSPRPSTAGATT